MEIVHGGGRRQQLIPIEALGQDRRRPWLEGPTAAGAVPLRQLVENTLGLHGVTFDDGSAGRPLVLQERVARGTAVASYRRDLDDPLRLPRVKGMASRPRMSRSRTLRLGGRRRRGVRLDGPLGRRSRRAEKTLRGLPFLVAELLLQTLECRGEPIDLPLFLQTLGTPVNRHHDSDPTPSGAPPGGSHTGTDAPRSVTDQRAEPGATMHAPQSKPGKRQDTGKLGTTQGKTAESVWRMASADAKLSHQWAHSGKIR